MLWPRQVWWVASDRVDLAASATRGAECSSCGAPAPEGECSTCAAAQARHAGASFVLGVLGVFFGVAVALGFPLLWPRAALGWHALAACAAAVAPVAGLGSWAKPRAFWGSPPRVWPLAVAGAIVERRELAERLASPAPVPLRTLWLPPLVYRPRWWPLPALAIGLALLAYGWHHPRLWVVNFTPEPVRVRVDGEPAMVIDPAGLDAARAAVSLRLPRGDHELAALDPDGRLLETVRAHLDSGKDHLYAPASDGRCFWLELMSYGRQTSTASEPSLSAPSAAAPSAPAAVRPLISASRFFSIDADVDAWFAESPEPPGSDRRSSGGTLTALRQSPCARAPEAVRRATSAVGP